MTTDRLTIVLPSTKAAEMAEALLDAAYISQETEEQQRVEFIQDRAVAIPVDEITDHAVDDVDISFDVTP